jgi:hypothetical protein
MSQSALHSTSHGYSDVELDCLRAIGSCSKSDPFKELAALEPILDKLRSAQRPFVQAKHCQSNRNAALHTLQQWMEREFPDSGAVTCWRISPSIGGVVTRRQIEPAEVFLRIPDSIALVASELVMSFDPLCQSIPSV